MYRHLSLVIGCAALVCAGFAQSPQIGRRSANITVGTAHFPANFTLSVDYCEVNSGQIRCQMALRHNGPRENTDQNARQFLRTMRLYDDANSFHMRRSATFLNGRGEPADFANFSRGDVMGYVVEFDGRTSDIRSARIVLPNHQEIRGIPVRQGHD